MKDYKSGGTQMPGRFFIGETYRFGFNGKEKDPETVATGGPVYDYGFRIYHPGLGRFLSADPLTGSFPWWSPYQFAGNTPIQAVDLDGLEILSIHSGWYNQIYVGKLGISNKPTYTVGVNSNYPKNYRPNNSNIVGGAGHDELLKGPYFQQGTFKYTNEDDGKSATTTDYIRNQKGKPVTNPGSTDPIFSDKIPVNNPGATKVDAFLLLKEMYEKGIKPYLTADWDNEGMDRQEKIQRQAFYMATNLVDNLYKSNSSDLANFDKPFNELGFSDLTFGQGRARGDLINFIQDGTLPSLPSGANNSIISSLYRSAIKELGIKILNLNKIAVDPVVKKNSYN